MRSRKQCVYRQASDFDAFDHQRNLFGWSIVPSLAIVRLVTWPRWINVGFASALWEVEDPIHRNPCRSIQPTLVCLIALERSIRDFDDQGKIFWGGMVVE